MEEKYIEEKEAELTKLLGQLFSEHSVRNEQREGKILFPEQQMEALTYLYDKTTSNTYVVQLDVILKIGIGRNIVESNVGIGNTTDEAVQDAFVNFVANTFHVLLSAFFTSKFDSEVSVEEWMVGGTRCKVVSSNVGIRGTTPSPFPTEWIDQFKESVQNRQLSNGTHWMRLFYALYENEISTCEVLLDNDVWEEVQEEAKGYNLPQSESYCSFRMFFLLQNEKPDISRLSNTIVWIVGDEEKDRDIIADEILNIYRQKGMSALNAEKAYLMIPLAFSQAFFEQIAPNVASSDSVIINSMKKQVEIDLMDEEIYAETYEFAKYLLVHNLVGGNTLMPILSVSSTFNAFNNALNEGGQAEDLEKLSSVLYLSDYPID